MIHFFRYLALVILTLTLGACSNVKFGPAGSAAGKLTVENGQKTDEEIDAETQDQINREQSQDQTDDGQANESKYRSMCREMKSTQHKASVSLAPRASIEFQRGLLIAHGTSVRAISHFRGALSLRAGSIGSINNVRGFAQILGDPTGGYNTEIGVISNHRGIMLICGMTVERVVNFRGLIVVVDGDVGEVVDSRGYLRVINGDVDAVDGFRGVIRVIEGQVGSVVNHQGVLKTSL